MAHLSSLGNLVAMHDYHISRTVGLGGGGWVGKHLFLLSAYTQATSSPKAGLYFPFISRSESDCFVRRCKFTSFAVSVVGAREGMT